MGRAFDFQGAKKAARRIVHDTLSGLSTYTAPQSSVSTALYVRWHHKIDRFGDPESAGYAEVIEGVERIIFDREELAAKGIVVGRNGIVTMDEDGVSVKLRLETQEPVEGPIEEIWNVVRIN